MFDKGDKTNLKEVGVSIKSNSKCGKLGKPESFCFDATDDKICAVCITVFYFCFHWFEMNAIIISEIDIRIFVISIILS
jgi:hypothetical protein